MSDEIRIAHVQGNTQGEEKHTTEITLEQRTDATNESEEDGVGKIMFSGDGREGVSKPASKPANYTKHTPRVHLNRKGTFSMPFCDFRSGWMSFFMGALDFMDRDSAQSLGA